MAEILEPDARKALDSYEDLGASVENLRTTAIVSAAISLKRIADALTGPDAGRAIADNIYNGISTALFEAWQRGAPR